MAKGWVLSTGNLPREGLPRNSVDGITDHPDMTSAVDRGCKALAQLNLINMGVAQADLCIIWCSCQFVLSGAVLVKFAATACIILLAIFVFLFSPLH